jgi:hypothetical protein
MLARVLTVCLFSTGWFALTFVLAGAKPPDQPAKQDAQCREPAPIPAAVSAPGKTAAPSTTASDERLSCETLSICTSAPRNVTKVYPVADLVIPIEKTKNGKTTEDHLIALIKSTVAPKSWFDEGGTGTVEYFPLSLAVVVNQPPDVQEQVAEMLGALRRFQDTEVAVDVRFVCVAEEFWEKSEFNAKKCACDCAAKAGSEPKKYGPVRRDSAEVRFLNDIQVFELMESVQDDKRTCVMQAPKIKMFNGQEVTVKSLDQHLFATGVTIVTGPNGSSILVPKNEPVDIGGKMALQPVISADKKSVRLKIDADWEYEDIDFVPLSPITTSLNAKEANGADKPKESTQQVQVPIVRSFIFEKTLVLRDGHSALINMGTRPIERRQAFDTPVLGKIPYIGRLFKNVGYGKETERVLMLVTPRIIVADAEEARVVKATGAFEEQEEPPTTAKKCEDCCEKCPQCCQSKAADIVEKYYKACAEGHADEATKLAVQALALDPMCFSKPRTAPTGKGR